MFLKYTQIKAADFFANRASPKGAFKSTFTVKGECATYQIAISFLDEYDAVNFLSKIEIEINADKIQLIKDAVLYVNSKILIGHFDLFLDDKPELVFSVSQPFVKELGIEMPLLSKIVDIVVGTLNSFYPCFTAINNGEIDDVKAIDLLMLDPVCEV